MAVALGKKGWSLRQGAAGIARVQPHRRTHASASTMEPHTYRSCLTSISARTKQNPTVGHSFSRDSNCRRAASAAPAAAASCAAAAADSSAFDKGELRGGTFYLSWFYFFDGGLCALAVRAELGDLLRHGDTVSAAK
jgi:hypothetical protein